MSIPDALLEMHLPRGASAQDVKNAIKAYSTLIEQVTILHSHAVVVNTRLDKLITLRGTQVSAVQEFRKHTNLKGLVPVLSVLKQSLQAEHDALVARSRR